jgi:iron-sulfur cluster assembly protein
MSIIKICQKSITHFNNIMLKNNTHKLLLGVKGGGCNGLKYYIEPLDDQHDEIDKSDEIIPIGENNKIIVCGKSLMYLIGTEIKWEDNLLSSGITFNNPNAKSTCGCGDTFN